MKQRRKKKSWYEWRVMRRNHWYRTADSEEEARAVIADEHNWSRQNLEPLKRLWIIKVKVEEV